MGRERGEGGGYLWRLLVKTGCLVMTTRTVKGSRVHASHRGGSVQEEQEGVGGRVIAIDGSLIMALATILILVWLPCVCVCVCVCECVTVLLMSRE